MEVLEKHAIVGHDLVSFMAHLTSYSVPQIIFYLDMDYSNVLEMEIMTYLFHHIKVILERLTLVLLEFFRNCPQYKNAITANFVLVVAMS